jgi:hypothetical protein
MSLLIRTVSFALNVFRCVLQIGLRVCVTKVYLDMQVSSQSIGIGSHELTS